MGSSTLSLEEEELVRVWFVGGNGMGSRGGGNWEVVGVCFLHGMVSGCANAYV